MKPIVTQAESKSATRPEQMNHGTTLVMAIFIGICAVTIANQLGNFWPIQPWLNTAFVVTALVTSIAAFAPILAWPNVVLAAGLAAAIGGIAHAINTVTGLPFGRFDFTAAAGPRPLGLVPWWLPLVWGCIALTTRGVARLILHNSRSHPHHGYRVIGLATLLGLFSAMGLETFATRAANLWTPNATPLLNLASCLALHLFTQISITPLLIDKFPGPRPPNFRPLFVWAGINALMVLGLAAKQL